MTVGIVGMGYVGLPLAVAFAAAGEDVIGVVLDQRRVAAINEGRSYIEDVPDSDLSDRIRGSTRYGELAQADAVLLCVPTPLSANREPELGPLVDSARELSRVLRSGQLLVL